ncbi:dicarboxylate/amino acid:cation symporter [Corynebacterium epidermidicanis]|uniref:Na+/H+ dicarboxylate symporter n=1 Tax=Corynebacterium epidermidicanis TaxID=1050174 RepID=A0A0G3GT73_9CORY|nr:dicarboxylate/amino acid:cation symporter [Corynebacterium epidermidicanis]AKK04324.1 Na+/H+ dicarboxylate symporter [Corynebacterium epidermidicanis]
MKLTQSLLFRVIVAIILGIICSLFFPAPLARVFVTFNGLFGNFLGFFVPVLIFALITPAIASLGKGAGKWLGVTTGIAYVSTILSGLLAFGTAKLLYPHILQHGTPQAADIDAGALAPYFEVEMPAPMEVMAALLLAFTVGLGMTAVKSDTLYDAADQLRNVIMRVIEVFVIPLLPVFIFGIFLSMGMNGNLVETLTSFGTVLLLATAMTWVVLILQFLCAGVIAGRNPFVALRNMLPAYGTALGTSSSAATIPVTYKSALKNGVSESVAGFVIPLCATIHLSGSMMKITLFALSILFMSDMDISVGKVMGFIFLLGIMMIAAPGVPGGAIMAAVGLLQSSLGFDDSQVALMIAAYIAIDSFGTACNVTGDGAIAMMVNKFARGTLGDRTEASAGAAAAGSIARS